MRIALPLLTLKLASAASAQSWEFTFSNPALSPSNPSTVVTLWAAFDPGDWALRYAELSLLSTEPGWSMPPELLLHHPGQQPGVLDPGGLRIADIRPAQICTFGFIPDSSNPLAVWRTTFTVTDFASARDIAVATETDSFVVFASEWPYCLMEPRTPIDVEATIRVVPAPGVLAVIMLGASALVSGRRRRPTCTITPLTDKGVDR